MSKEQKTLKACYILDRLREWFELYGNQNRQRAEEELQLAIDELYEYQQKDRQLADLEAKLAEYEKFMKDNEWNSIEEMQETLNKCEKEYFDIQKQLEEKEKERELDNSFWKQECDSLQKTLEEKEKEVEFIKNMKADEMALKVIQKGNQDKISFAIAELEKVKSAFSLINSKLDKVETIKEYIHYIDHQIKQLKELK